MDVKLHANATTTPKVRAYIQASSASVAELAEELGLHETTIRRWRSRDAVNDRSHRPHRLATSLSEIEERLVCELRTSLGLSLDDLVEVMHRCVNPKLSRSAIHRTLRRHDISKSPPPQAAKPGRFETDRPLGFIHLDIKYLTRLARKPAYVFVAIDRATRYVYAEILTDRKAATAQAFIERFLDHFPGTVHTILTDNGSEWTDRFADDKKGKAPGKPSGGHLVDLLCAQHGIRHKLTKPYRPQTNGLVERFNRRISEHLGKRPKRQRGQDRRFESHDERNRYILDFVHAYNQTRLRCLDYKAPLELLSKLTVHNTPLRGRDGVGGHAAIAVNYSPHTCMSWIGVGYRISAPSG